MIQLFVVFALLLATEFSQDPVDTGALQAKMQVLIDRVDSPEYARELTWDEHVVLVHRVILGRLPTPEELFLLRHFRDDIGLSRSVVLSVVMRGRAPALTLAHCAELVRRIAIADLVSHPELRMQTAELLEVPQERIVERLRQRWAVARPSGTPGPQAPATPVLVNEPFETYFGYLHAHSELSDGEGSAATAYAYARDSGGLDFFALTDHGELLAIWPWEDKWDQLVEAAHAAHEEGSYVTLWGFEWSHPLLGHINVINSQDYTGALAETSLGDIYDWISGRPAAFARFNHPGRYDDVGTEFMHMTPYPAVREQMVGMSTWNKDDSFDTHYYAGGWSSAYAYIDEGNRLGWHLGAFGAQDNHSQDWGTRNDFRTAVLARDLTRPEIIDAYRSRRLYATEDLDLYLDLRCQGQPMGARLTGGERRFRLTASDASGDVFVEARLYRDGDLLQTQVVSGNSVSVIFDDSTYTSDAYYYVIVRQSDDGDGNGRNDEAISSPIWITH